MNPAKLKVQPADEGMRLDRFLAQALAPEISRAQGQRLLKQGLVLVDGRTAKAADKLKAGQMVAVEIPAPTPLELIPQAMDLTVLYEDRHLIVVNKPPGVVVHPSPGHSQGTLVHGLLYHCGDLAGVGGKLRPGIVHRLDKDTSGALVAAKNDMAHRRLVAQFAAGRVNKRYLALVHGKLPLNGEITAGIGRHPVDRKKMSAKGRHTKAAHTSWRRLMSFPSGFSLLLVTIKTGRTHQIRVHVAEAGFPVTGDATYGGRRGRKTPQGALGQALQQAGRQMLHAVHLSFSHPLEDFRVSVTAGLPQDFRRVLKALRENEND